MSQADVSKSQPLDVPGVPNCSRVSDDLLRGGQPSRDGFLALRSLGVRTVVNVRLHHDDGAAAMAHLGMDYVHLGMSTWLPTPEQVECFLGVVTDPDHVPVFLHCQHGADRTGVFVAVYRMVVQGWSADVATDEMIHGGFGHQCHLWGHLKDFIRSYDVEAARRRLGIPEPKRDGGSCVGVTRYLVLSASVGAGHMRAAEAVEAAIRERDPGAEVRNVDVLTLAGRGFRKLYGSAYLDLVNRAPHVLGWIYDLADRPPSPSAKRDRLRTCIDRLNLKPLRKLFLEEPWDVVVSTHFLPAEILAGLKREGATDLPQIVVTTDFDTHRFWVNEPCERYTTATEEGATYLASFGIDPARIAVTGIPIHPDFTRLPDRASARRAWGLDDERPVILQMCGGFGVGPVEATAAAIMAQERPLQLVVAVGRNEDLRAKLEAQKVPSRHRLLAQGFTTRIGELMAAADIVVSKPGGLTTSETLAAGAGMVVVNPIPGQESRNSDYLLEEGAAVKVNSVHTMALKLGRLLENEEAFAALRAAARRIAKPRAAFDVADLAAELARRRR